MTAKLQAVVGRPILWGLAHNGQKGVENIVEILKAELDLAMALSGRTVQFLKCIIRVWIKKQVSLKIQHIFIYGNYYIPGCSSVEDVDSSLILGTERFSKM